MGDSNQTTTPGYDRAANAPDAAALDKGKGKATQPSHEENLEEDSDESENEEMLEDVEEDDGDDLEPISADNIISGGRRTRGKTVDYQAAAEKLRADNLDEDDEDDDEDYVGADEDEDTVMRG
ncbi:histone H2A.Z-specific chaperone CHZ1 [Aspergillus homomorphus CBS 101889]|uniref:Histone chaperone domain-containing protein n=1 Tax=Aspergillus homomorphus (strain CBS 101889) TaxID=1450537 RepID=A0A395HT75_ASPHC|nr:hypothetical protein BO97DRAFT_406750 [Aspergillus homomorphus CBS 101889]RAL10756.1 hypothetical protein BO97DRAFT_406750 [Aspergillus homomorphus CBS 101889]